MDKMYKKGSEVLSVTADKIGSTYTFIVVLVMILGWFIYGGLSGYQQTWFDIIDMTIFITNFLMIFILQRSQNADTEALQSKLDELIDNVQGARESKKSLEKQKKKGN